MYYTNTNKSKKHQNTKTGNTLRGALFSCLHSNDKKEYKKTQRYIYDWETREGKYESEKREKRDGCSNY